MGLYTSYGDAVIATPNVIGYWRLNETSGTVAADSSGLGHPGTYTGGVTLGTAGALADGTTAATFDGVNDYIAMPAGSFPPSAAAYTVECWVKFTSAPQRALVSNRHATPGGGTNYFGLSGNVPFWYDSRAASPVISTTTALNNNAWHHIVYVRASATVREIYVDGAIAAAQMTTLSGLDPVNRIDVAFDLSNGEYFAGALDEVAVYSRALTAAEIADHYARRTITGTDRPRMYALGGIARGGATRGAYTSAYTYIRIGGVQVGHRSTDPAARVLLRSLTINDTIGEHPSTAHCQTHGFVPPVGAELVVTLGSINNRDRLFGGQILAVQQTARDTPAATIRDISAIDWTWGLNRRRVTRVWTATSASDIVRDIITDYCPGYLTTRVRSGLEALEELSASDEEVTDLLTRIANRIGVSWLVDYHRVIHFPIDTSQLTNPVTLTARRRYFNDPQIRSDLSQVVTRVSVKGGATRATADVAAGTTLLPVETTGWHPPSGWAAIGHNRITYTHMTAGGSGALIGPGLAPSAAPTGTAVVGGAIEAGVHDYAVTFTTATGETIPGPRLTILVGTLAAPATAPTPLSVGDGTGPDPGAHQWACTFVTASGETTASPISAVATTADVVPPASAPGLSGPNAGGSITPGAHSYGITYITAAGGETTVSPLATVTITAPTANPTTAPAATLASSGGGLTVGAAYRWRYTFVRTDGAQTLGSPVSAAFVPANSGETIVGIALAGLDAIPAGHTRRWYRTAGNGSTYKETIGVESGGYFTDGTADGALGATEPATNTTSQQTILVNAPIGGAGVVDRYLYRTAAGGSVLKWLTNLGHNAAGYFPDTYADAALGAASPPATNLAFRRVVALGNLPIGPSGVTARNLYRTAAGGSQLKLALTIANNTATTATDTVADASLGAAAPTTATAPANAVALAGVPIGPTGTTGRPIYRTAAGGSQLKLALTIANNTATTATDTVADASLGAAAPTGDTSSLAAVAGQVIPGATTIPVTNPGAFDPAGGWAIAGTHAIRYSGTSATALTGIPASGNGAIAAPLVYGATIQAAPQFHGIPASGAGAIVYPIRRGDEVAVWIVEDEVAAQATIAALIGGDGVLEDVLVDQRLGYAEATARARAHLAQRAAVLETVAGSTRDPNTRSGRLVTYALPEYLEGTYRLQHVTIAHFQEGGTMPTFTFEASSRRYTFEELLRITRRDETG